MLVLLLVGFGRKYNIGKTVNRNTIHTVVKTRQCAKERRKFMVENYKEEFMIASDADPSRVGYIQHRNRRLTINTNSNPDKSLSGAL